MQNHPLGPGDPRQIGAYRLLERLGHGSLGHVYLGRSPGGRLVVLRLVAPYLSGDESFRRRFAHQVARARGVGGLYTAQVVDADVGADPPWVVTAYVPGPTLRQAVERYGPLPDMTVHVLGSGLAEGLAGVHACGLLHGNLKPTNVILAADGPRIVDFGHAHALGTAQVSTAVAGFSGFPAPEQVRGEQPGPYSDVFALGCVLVYASSGRGPFGQDAETDVLHRVVTAAPDLRGVPPYLVDLVAACLAKDPVRRPGLGEVLRRLARPGLVAAMWLPPEVAAMARERQGVTGIRRFLGRRGFVAAGVGALAAAVGVPVGIAITSDSGDGPTGNGPTGGGSPVPSGTPPRQDAPLYGSPLVPLATLDLDGESGASELAFSPDGRLLAATSTDNGPLLWDAATWRRIDAPQVGDHAGIQSLAVSNDLVAVGYNAPATVEAGQFKFDEGEATVWDTATLRESGRLRTGSLGSVKIMRLPALAFSPDGRILAGLRPETERLYTVLLWDAASQQTTAELTVGTGLTSVTEVSSIRFSPDGKLLAVGYHADELQGGVALFDAVSLALIATLTVDHETLGVGSLAFSPDGRFLAGSCDGVTVWDVAARPPVPVYRDDSERVQSVAFGADGTTVIGGWSANDAGGEFIVWDLRTRTKNASVRTGRSGVGTVALSPDGKTIAASVESSQKQHTLQLWTFA